MILLIYLRKKLFNYLRNTKNYFIVPKNKKSIKIIYKLKTKYFFL